MTGNGRRRIKRFAVSASVAILAATAAGYFIGPLAALVVAALGFLAVAVASDDNLGTCLPLAVFLLIGLALLAMMLVMVIKVNT